MRILFSALIDPDCIIAEILKEEPNFQFTAPKFIKEEIKRHWKRIEQLTTLSKKALKEEWKLLQERIRIVNADDVPEELYQKSYDIVKDIDEYDLYFLALHFQTGHKIWTGDKKLRKGLEAKGLFICVSTEELKAKRYKKKQ